MFYNDLFFVLNGIFDGNDGQFSEIVLIFCKFNYIFILFPNNCDKLTIIKL